MGVNDLTLMLALKSVKSKVAFLTPCISIEISVKFTAKSLHKKVFERHFLEKILLI